MARAKKEKPQQHNHIDLDFKFDSTCKVVSCSSCGAVWMDRKIPAKCPYCGAPKKGNLAGAKEDALNSFMDAYSEAMEERLEEQEDAYPEEQYPEEAASYSGYGDTYGGYGDSARDEGDVSGDPYRGEDASGRDDEYPDADYPDDVYPDDPDSPDSPDYPDDPGDGPAAGGGMGTDADTYEPIGYDPDSFFLEEDVKVTKEQMEEALSAALQAVKDRKREVSRAGLPTDFFSPLPSQIRQFASQHGNCVGEYTQMLLMQAVDMTIQRALRHPVRVYTREDIDTMLEELGIRAACWDSYYAVAGLDDR